MQEIIIRLKIRVGFLSVFIIWLFAVPKSALRVIIYVNQGLTTCHFAGNYYKIENTYSFLSVFIIWMFAVTNANFESHDICKSRFTHLSLC